MVFTLTELLNYFSAILGMVVSAVVMTKMKGKESIRFSLFMVLWVGSVCVFLGTLMYTGKVLSFPYIMRFESPIHYVLPPACYFYTLASLRPEFRFRWIHLLHLLPFLLNLIEFLPFYLSGPETKIDYYLNQKINADTVILPFHYRTKAISAVVYVGLEFYLFIRYGLLKKTVSRQEKSVVTWFAIYLGTQATVALGLAIDNVTGLMLFGDPFKFSTLIVSFFLFAIAMALLFLPNLLYGYTDPPSPTARRKYKSSSLSRDEKHLILEQLRGYMEGTHQPFLNPNLSIAFVGEELELNSQKISQVINELLGINFNDFINFYRVEEAKNMLTSEEMEKITIEAIAEQSGFNSKSPFYTAFKKHTGLSPKQYVKQARPTPSS